MFWFFKKKEGDITNLNSKLQTSFTNLKQDIGIIHEWIEHFKGEHNNHKNHHKKHYDNHNNISREIQFLREEIKEIRAFMFTNKTPEKPIKIEQFNEEQIFQDETIPNLTDSQKNVMGRIYTLLKEEGAEWIPMKYLTRDLYPNTKYEDVKSMMSIYTDLFLNFGLINKKRKGRETLISLTEKSKKLFKDTKKEIKVKSKKKSS